MRPALTIAAEHRSAATADAPSASLRVRIRCVANDQQRRMQQAAAQAHSAQDRGDLVAANEAWRRYVLIEDALRDPQELLDEGVALSKVAIDLWLQR